jgi:RNA polymerase-binding transcription factor DksA
MNEDESIELTRLIEERILELNSMTTGDDLEKTRRAKELNQLHANLEWLHSDDAGFCSSCDCEIPFARLKAVLTTQLCIECASKQEG